MERVNVHPAEARRATARKHRKKIRNRRILVYSLSLIAIVFIVQLVSEGEAGLAIIDFAKNIPTVAESLIPKSRVENTGESKAATDDNSAPSPIAPAQDDTATQQPFDDSAENPPNADRAPQSDDWNLLLVNGKNPLNENYLPKLTSVGNGYQFDERAADHLHAMLSAAQAEGLSPIICSAYRSVEKQQQLYDGQVEAQMVMGLAYDQADKRARTIVAFPGTSEHNLGLAVDIVSLHYQLLEDDQADTPEAKCIAENCSNYGFILRYPKDKVDITGVIYEPWHFRYVGVEAAKEIMESGVCLEEFLGHA